MSEPHHDVEAVFLAALDRPTPHEREAYAQQVCGDRPELLRRVRELLASHQQSRGPLDAPPPGLEGTVDLPGAQRPGTLIGPYKLLEPIGEGGMGAVWMAEQQAPVRRCVALKLVKPGMDSKQVVARFEAERQALALMDHPNIARVLDGGTTPSGRPYFVMDLVKGVPLTRYCDDHKLTPRQRLELFVPVCQAVQHAHQKGVIHRDLKPSNVLVAPYDGRPVPKVIDFGVAKAAGAPLTEKTLVTGFGAVIGTPEYMSPEQAELNNQDIDTRSDVYGLGVLLYELLTGTTPLTRQRVKDGSLLEILRLVREDEPARPSTRLSTVAELPTIAGNRGLEAKKLSGVVRGELDWVVMKCLNKDRNRRYQTPHELAQDLEHYLRNEPVSAGPPSVWYQFRKFVQRRRRALATAGLLGVMLLAAVGGVAGSLAWGARDRSARIAVAEGKATAALDEANGLQRQKKWTEALEAAKRAQGLLPQDGSEELRARVQEMLKDVNMVLTLAEIRSPHSREGFDREAAVRAYAEAFREYGIDVEALEPAEAARLVRDRTIQVELTVALDHWALYTLDEARKKRLIAVARAADPDDWRNQIRDAWAGGDVDVLCKLAVSPRVRELPVQTLSLLGSILDSRSRNKEAIHVLRVAQQTYPDDGEINSQLGWALDHAPGAKDSLADVVRFYTVQRALWPRHPDIHLHLGDKLAQQGKFDEAAAVYRRAFELRPDAGTAQRLIGVLQKQGNTDEEVAVARKVIALRPDDPQGYDWLAAALERQARVDEALETYRKLVALKPNDDSAAGNLAAALQRHGKGTEAIEVCRQAVERRPGDGAAHYRLGSYLEQNGKTVEAIAAYRKAIALKPDHGIAYFQLAELLNRQGEPDQAIDVRRKLIEIKPDAIGNHMALANALIAQGKRDEAGDVYRKFIEHHANEHTAYVLLARILEMQGKRDEASAVYRKVAGCKAPDGRCSEVAQVILADFLASRGSLDEALATFRKAVALDPKHTDYAQYRIVDILERQGKAAEARADLCRIIDSKPGEAVAHHRLGRLLMSGGESHGAILAFRDALRLYPRASNTHLMNDADGTPARLVAVNDLAGAYLAAGLFDLAEPLLIQGYEGMKQREATSAQAGKERLTEVLERLVGLYEATGQKDKAAAWRKKLDERKAPTKRPAP